MSWQAGLGIGLSILGLLSAAFTADFSLIAVAGINGALASVSTLDLLSGAASMVGDISGIVSGVSERKEPKLSAISGWISMAAGVLSLGSGLLSVASRKLSMMEHSAPPEVIHLGSDIRNIRPVGRTSGPGNFRSFIFEDTYKERPRINIIVHGELLPNFPISVGFIDQERSIPLSGAELANWMKDEMGIRFNQYGYARTLSCYSANGGIFSFASGFSRSAQLPTKGFLGSVTVASSSALRKAIDYVSDTATVSNPQGYISSFLQYFKENQAEERIIEVMKNTEEFNYRPKKFNYP
ncbi:hypothetical protein [Winslowiella iniecta]|uniref:hypothetical protein n=1 Tax=Winslowiella iniecta TaxID=1560201 RepID=UPI001F4D1FA6|nr:hypothetical protein [Winslowiella iniecta]